MVNQAGDVSGGVERGASINGIGVTVVIVTVIMMRMNSARQEMTD